MKDYAFSPDRIARRTNITVVDKTIQLLDGTLYSRNNILNAVAKRGAKQAYQHMRSGEHPREQGTRPAEIQLLIYYPITEAQSKALNADNASKARFAGGAIGVITSRVHPAVGIAAGVKTFDWSLNSLRSWDAGDIYMRLQISVIGGTGPQRSNRSVVIKRNVYNENNLKI